MNRHVLLRTRDFKSRASASFAIRADAQIIETEGLLYIRAVFIALNDGGRDVSRSDTANIVERTRSTRTGHKEHAAKGTTSIEEHE